ncbi:hypothetical protein DFJ74DRAFT_709892 [Hyaloraphidium curvatum]|nr:hypothetical protein DFJ74DRAFT_709892 [Hyaloraphidium curvatum]
MLMNNAIVYTHHFHGHLIEFLWTLHLRLQPARDPRLRHPALRGPHTSPLYSAYPFLRDSTVGTAASVVFLIPVLRELLLSVGYLHASRPACERAIAEGKSLRKRGFARLAPETGAELVPTYCFHKHRHVRDQHRLPLTVAVGNPVPWPAGYDDAMAEARTVPLNGDGERWRAPEGMVDEYQIAYQEALGALFERCKAAAGYLPERALRIFED